MSLKALNDTARPDVQVTYCLVFGELPRLTVPQASDNRPPKADCGILAVFVRQ